jgi:hypothetical protein
MKIYMDWEFLEDGITVQPISVGMIREDGKELYYEFLNAPSIDILKREWLKENVVPHLSAGWTKAMLTGMSDEVVKSRLAIRNKVYDFLLDAWKLDKLNGFELWGWYSAYDHLCLAQLFGKMIDLPDWCPMYTNDVRQEFHRLGDPSYPRQTEGLHNALADAKFLMKRHQWLMNYENDLNSKLSGFQIGNGNIQNNSF